MSYDYIYLFLHTKTKLFIYTEGKAVRYVTTKVNTRHTPGPYSFHTSSATRFISPHWDNCAHCLSDDYWFIRRHIGSGFHPRASGNECDSNGRSCFLSRGGGKVMCPFVDVGFYNCRYMIWFRWSILLLI